MSDLRYFARRVLDAHSEPLAHDQFRAFAAGRWKLVDCFDADGRRYLIASRSSESAELDPEEQQLVLRRARGDALKEIAIDLGVSISLVSRKLASAMQKLGVRSHADLPRLFAALEPL